MSAEPIQILLVDDHMVVRKGLVHVLGSADGIDIVGEAESGEEALYLIQKLKPDVVLMDIKMDGMGGIEATRMISQHHGTARIIGISTFSNREVVEGILDAGANGFLLKDVSASELLETIRKVHDGEVLRPHHLLSQPEKPDEPAPVAVRSEDAPQLGKQQKRVLALMTKGLTNPEIAEQLGVSRPTARYHVSAILRKLDVSNRSEAVAMAIRENLVGQDDVG